LSATATEDKIVGNSIQFTKNNVEYTAMNFRADLSIDELKKICESLVPVKAPPSDINIYERDLTVSDELSFKTLQPGDFVVPQGYKFQYILSNIHFKGNEKSETCSISYATETGYPVLEVIMNIGGHPFGDQTPMLTPNSDYDTKQINGTTVKLCKTNNSNLPAAKFTIPVNGLEFTLSAPGLQQSEVEKVVTSILQAYAKL